MRSASVGVMRPRGRGAYLLALPLAALLLLAMLAGGARPAGAQTCDQVAHPTGNTIQQAVNAASSGQTVCVVTGTFNRAGDQVVVINKPLTVVAVGSPVISGISASNSWTVTASNVTIEGLTFRAAAVSSGRVLQVAAGTTGIVIKDNVFDGSLATDEGIGGPWVFSAQATITGNTVTNAWGEGIVVRHGGVPGTPGGVYVIQGNSVTRSAASVAANFPHIKLNHAPASLNGQTGQTNLEYARIIVCANEAPRAEVAGSVATSCPTPAPQPVTAKEACKNGGWAAKGFRNQGQCIASVVSSPNSRHHR